ncbi:alpha/beta fold hydrolase [Candidatus Kaiserbacteria bacterium]|nr:alpha/beta fold hydrolase [Candidatus Kaiserbacteria bacterium]
MNRIETVFVSLLFCTAFALPFFVAALESPKQIGYYCNPDVASIVEGQYYTLPSDFCNYVSPSLGGFGIFRVGDLYRGVPGAAERVIGHGLGQSTNSSQQGDLTNVNFLGIGQGEDMFAVIYEERTWLGNYDVEHFRDFFATGNTAAPHQNYGFIRFKYGAAPPPEPDEPDPVIIIPGILGSEKNSAGEWIIDPILHTYDDLIATLDANGYTPGVDLFPFPYNWRKSNVETALLLKEKIDAVKEICECDKVDLVAHSMGGLVARQYIQSESYEQDVDQLIFLGTPHLGAPKAYLMWEGGEIGPFLDPLDTAMEIILSHEGYEQRFPHLFDYIRATPIDSVRELLPTYDYIFDDSQLRDYPINYPANTFLEDLNANVANLFNSDVEIHNIIGDIADQKTIVGINAIDSSEYLPKWLHGYPEDFYDLLGDHGLVRGQGDQTVPLSSASFVNENLVSTSSTHTTLPDNAKGKIFEILTGSESSSLVDNVNLVNLKLIFIKILSPADLLVISPDNKKIGKENGQEVNEIPNSFYTGFNTDTEFITILNPIDGEYRVFTEGIDTGPYTVETAYISDGAVTESSFTGNTMPGLVTELNVSVNNQDPQPDITPADIAPPVIIITAPDVRDYLRSEQLPVDVSAIDEGSGLHLLESRFDSVTIPNVGTIDLFYKSLGSHTFFASSIDNVNNESTESRTLKVIANATSTRDDISRAYSLTWMTKKIYDDLLKKFNGCFKEKKTLTSVTKTIVIAGKNGKPPTTRKVTEKITRVEIYFDKNTAKDMLKTLDKYRGKGMNEQGYQLIKEDVQWLINN